MARTIGAIVAGLVLAVALMFAIEFAGHQIYHVREVDMRDSEAVAAMIASMPTGALLFVVAAWLVGSFAGALAAGMLAGRVGAAWLVGALVAALGVTNVLMYPHPEWMQVSAVIAPAIGALIGGHIARARLRTVSAAAP